MEIKHKQLTEDIIGAYYDIYNDMGYGFNEKVYQNSMYFELIDRGLSVEAQKPIMVFRKGKRVGEFFADLVINDLIIVELKATSVILEEHEAQLLNYLKASEIEVGLLYNFGKDPEFMRKVWENSLKKHIKNTAIKR